MLHLIIMFAKFNSNEDFLVLPDFVQHISKPTITNPKLTILRNRFKGSCRYVTRTDIVDAGPHPKRFEAVVRVCICSFS